MPSLRLRIGRHFVLARQLLTFSHRTYWPCRHGFRRAKMPATAAAREYASLISYGADMRPAKRYRAFLRLHARHTTRERQQNCLAFIIIYIYDDKI